MAQLPFTPAQKFLNREISWLEFNARILDEVTNKTIPLLERGKLLAISALNLNEFLMVRMGRLYAPIASPDFNTIEHQKELRLINRKIKQIIKRQNKCFAQLSAIFKKKHIAILKASQLNNKDKHWLSGQFIANILPKLKSEIFSLDGPPPLLPNLKTLAIFSLKKAKKNYVGLVTLSHFDNMWIALPGPKVALIHLQEVIIYFQNLLFPEYRIKSINFLQAIKNADVYIDQEDIENDISSFNETSFTNQVEALLEKRQKAPIILIKLDKHIKKKLLHWLTQQMHLTKEQILLAGNSLKARDMIELYNLNQPKLKYPLYVPHLPKILINSTGDYFKSIKKYEFINYHPYDSFEVVMKFLQQAAHDPHVTEIKQTLYRTSCNSPIITALIAAAAAGKKVTVLIELRARFDEKDNIDCAIRMETAGIKVVYGLQNYKTHAKLSLITRKNGRRTSHFVHFGTGNYHPIKAQVYSDISYFTSNPTLVKDAENFFNALVEQKFYPNLKKLITAPLNLREKLLALIQQEINHAKAGRPANIWIKCNAITDPQIIDKLYQASQAGVKIILIIRGICCLRPQVKYLSDNIMVKSIVGRFLEHTRVYCFGNGQAIPSEQTLVYIASADLMERNLDKRIEIMVPIENRRIHDHILEHVMLANIRDNMQSWVLNSNGSYTRTLKPNRRVFHQSANKFSLHDYLLQNIHDIS